MLRSPRRPSSEAVDDYLKALLALAGNDAARRVSSNDLAAQLGVRAASVTGMLQKLAAHTPPLVEYQKHHGAQLTPAGRRRAWELVRHHRLLELFLHDVLGYAWDEVHEEADRLEHFISERFEDRVAAILGNPELDPHGHAIPHKHGHGSFPREVPLPGWSVGTPARINSVSDRQPAALRALARLGLRPGVEVVVAAAGADGSVQVRLPAQAGARAPVRLKRAWASAVGVVPAGNST